MRGGGEREREMRGGGEGEGNGGEREREMRGGEREREMEREREGGRSSVMHLLLFSQYVTTLSGLLGQSVQKPVILVSVLDTENHIPHLLSQSSATITVRPLDAG